MSNSSTSRYESENRRYQRTAANYDLGFEVPPFEQRRPRFDHGIYCSLSDSLYCSLSDSFTEFLQHSPIGRPIAKLLAETQRQAMVEVQLSLQYRRIG
jgi:hypothetical protein